MNFPATHLPSWLQRAMHAPCPTTVEFPDSGYVTVFPQEQLYMTDIQDIKRLSDLSDDTAQFKVLQETPEKREVQPLNQLHWTLTLQRLQSRPQSYEFQYNMVKLQSWPSLTYMPEEMVPAVARICALLARKPTTASLIPLTLGLPEARVFALIEVLRLNGHLQVNGFAPSDSVQQNAEAQEVLANASQPASVSGASFISKLWQRLTSGN